MSGIDYYYGLTSRRTALAAHLTDWGKDRIASLVKDITAVGGNAVGFKTDVARRGNVEALVKNASGEHGQIDVIVKNSGIMPIAPMADSRSRIGIG